MNVSAQIIIDTTKPYFTFIPSNKTLELNVTGLNVNFTGTDAVGFGTYNISDKTNFTINSTGGVVNATRLARYDYILNVTINDTSNNINWTLFNVSVQDTLKPYFTSIPANATLEYKTTGLMVDFNAYDVGTGMYNYLVNNTNFAINTTGGLINSTQLSLGNHYLNISINDTQGLMNETAYKVFVNDTTSPVFTTINNISIYTNQSVLGDYSATDLDTITWNLNDTTKFSINLTGDIYNTSSLSIGVYYLIVYINDSSNNKVTKDINITVNSQVDTSPPIITNPSNQTLELNVTGLLVDFSATDDTGIGTWLVNDSTNFQINSTGWIKNITMLINKTYFVNITINDSSNNLNSTIFKIDVNDTLKPYFNPLPVNQTIYTNQSLRYDINAFDIGVAGISYSVNNTINFLMNSTGGLNNITTLTIQNYTINISINDTQGNLNSSMMSVSFATELDLIKPYFSHLLNNQTYYYHIGISYDINATDETAFGSYAVNDSRFEINSSGNLKNSSQLAVRGYYVNISINDTNNNLNSTMLNISVNQSNSVIYMSIAGSRANSSKDNNTNINFSAELILGFTENITILINDSISANNSLITSNTTKITEVGNDYNITAIYYGNTNFSKASETWWLDVSEYSAPQITETTSGGSSGTSPFFVSDNVCEILYFYLINNTSDTSLLYNVVKEKQKSINLIELQYYKNNWQGLCSDKINKTLMPEFICESIYKFIISNENYTKIDLENLRKNIFEKIKISENVLNNYISEYDSECYGNYYSKNLSSEKMRTIGVIVENFTTPSLNFLELMADYFLSPYILYEKKENKSITQKVLLNFVNMKNEFNLVKIIFLFVDNF